MVDSARVGVVGSVNLDTVYGVADLPRVGETVLAATTASGPGGKGGNQAVAAARAGAAVRFVGAVGDDAAGRRLREHLAANRVDLQGLVCRPEPSGRALIVVDDAGQNMIVVSPGANGGLELDAATRAVIAGCATVLIQLEIPVATAVDAATAARAAGATVIVNASPVRAGLEELAALTDVVVVNEAEAAHWRWPVPHRVLTLGADGARYDGSAGRFAVPALPVSPVDTAGAGDVFAGVLAAGWSAGPHVAVRRACVAGGLATLVRGAGDCAQSAAAIDAALPDLP
ncbi:PfkB family carbohydrate kinase [Mycobacterium sp. 1274756.6]|uniref:PfkB family carbohydrate kinase n=1 Tax=Mycobacterium sp. 1274756.6 TaxID=1834076 RepID=UPI000B23E228|nr:PfkB family carbohydrate kinase [Mycobacterium sp. 1274756.6]